MQLAAYFLRWEAIITKILAFDQSTQMTGWSLYVDDILDSYGLIDLHSIKDMPTRMRHMGMEIYKKITEMSPDMIAIEDVSLQNPNVKTIVELARLQGMILQSVSLIGDLSIVIYSPSSWRKIVGIQTGRGIKRTELKSAAIKLAEDLYGINVSDDIADAILLGKAACSHRE